MKPRTFVPALTAAQRQRLREGLRATEAFTARRCPILLAGADGTSPTALAYQLRRSARTVRNAVHAVAREGLACLQEKSSRPLTVRPVLGERSTDPLAAGQALGHQPRPGVRAKKKRATA